MANETIQINEQTSEILAKKEVRLGNPAYLKEANCPPFDVTLNGKIEIREFTIESKVQKSAYFQTKEGYSIRVNATFDHNKHKEGKVFKATVRETEMEINGQKRPVKYCVFADNQ